MAYDASAAVAFAQGKMGRYKNGECWTLIEDAVVSAGGKSSKDLTPNFSSVSSYVWGQSVTVGNLQPGDVLQFRGYNWEQALAVSTTFIPKHADNPDTTEKVPGLFEERGIPQHSAMVVRVISPGVVDVVEQNIPAGTGKVQTVRLVLIAGTPSVTSETLDFETAINNVTVKVRRTIKTTTTDTVTNPPLCYRPGA